MLTAQVHQGLLADSGIDLLAQSHQGLLSAVVVPVEPERPRGGFSTPEYRYRFERELRRDDDDLLLILQTIMEAIQ